MSKKILIVGVGGMRGMSLTEEAGVESADNILHVNAPPVILAFKHAYVKHVNELKQIDNEAAGLETQALDQAGIGTGLDNPVFQTVEKYVDFINVNNMTELKTTLSNEINKNQDRVAVLGNDIRVNKEDFDIMSDLASEGVVIYGPDELDKAANDLNETICSVDVEDDNDPSSGDDEQVPIDLGSVVNEPGKDVSDETKEENDRNKVGY